MNLLFFFLILLLFCTSSFQSDKISSINLFGNSTQDEVNYEENVELLDLNEIAHALKVLLTNNEILELIELIRPNTEDSTPCKDCLNEYKEGTVFTSKELYENIMKQDLTKVPIQELIDVPELLGNATHLRIINSRVNTQRPVRPRKCFRKKSPSKVPGSSTYIKELIEI